MLTPKILVLSGSDRSGSLNKALAQAAMKSLAQMEGEVTMIALADYPLPLRGQDGGPQKGLPDNAVRLAGMFAAHDALLVASPEHNGSIPPLLKNALDWAGEVTSDGRRAISPFGGLTVALTSASGEPHGGVRVLDHLRAVFVSLGALVVSEQCIVADAVEPFGRDGMPRNADAAAALQKACRALLDRCTPERAR